MPGATRTVRVRESQQVWQFAFYEFEVDASLTDEEAEAEAERMVTEGEVYPYDTRSADDGGGETEINEIELGPRRD